MGKIKIVIVDDVKEIRDYYKESLAKYDDVEIVASLDSGKKAVAFMKNDDADIILMDIQMENELAGIKATEQILEFNENVKIVILTIHDDDDLIAEAYLAGAIDYLVKSTDKDIYKKIKEINESTEFFSQKIVRSVLNNFKLLKKNQKSLLFVINILSGLTKTEKEVLKHLLNGDNRKIIPDLMYVEQTTIDWHIKNIRKKLDYPTVNLMLRDLNKMNIGEFLK